MVGAGTLASHSLAMTSDRLTALFELACASASATWSRPGSRCRKANRADASSTHGWLLLTRRGDAAFRDQFIGQARVRSQIWFEQVLRASGRTLDGDQTNLTICADFHLNVIAIAQPDRGADRGRNDDPSS